MWQVDQLSVSNERVIKGTAFERKAASFFSWTQELARPVTVDGRWKSFVKFP